MNVTRTLLATFALLLVGVSGASAEKLAALKIDVRGSVDPAIQSAVEDAIARAGASGSWTWIDADTTRKQLEVSARNCYTPACLQKVADSTGAGAGVRVRFKGEAQIYDWTIDVYDLRKGELASTKKGACELCGNAEVKAEFEASARGAIASARISPKEKKKPKTAVAADVEKQNPETPPARIADALPPIEPAATADDPLAGMTMVEINVTPPDASIKIGEQLIGTGHSVVSLEHGTYEITFAREGYGGLRETLVVGPDTSTKALLRVHLAKTDPDSVILPRDGGAVDQMGDRRPVFGYIGLATGGALLGTGLFLAYLDGRPTCSGTVESCPKLYRTGGAAFVTTMTGAVLATSGAALLAWDLLAGGAEKPAKTARIVPVLGPDQTGIGVVGRF